jgi:hypothetical protein
MSVQRRPGLKWSAITISVAWIVFAFWNQIIEPMYEYERRAKHTEERMNVCSGTFAQRFDCKSALLVTKQQKDFYFWAQGLLVMFFPPSLLAAFYSWHMRRLEQKEVEEYIAKKRAAIAKREAQRAAARERYVAEAEKDGRHVFQDLAD